MKILLFTFLLLSLNVAAQQRYAPSWESLNTRGIPEWFNREKFGIFIHWGVYSVPAYAPVIPNSGYSYAEWYWQRIVTKIPAFVEFHESRYGKNFTYFDFEKSFKAELFDPSQWASVFRQAGARYVVLTSKHHEGYALWDNPQANQTWGRNWNAVSGTPGRDLLGELSRAVRDSGLKMGYYFSLYEWYNPLWLKDKKAYVEQHMIPQFKDLVTKYRPAVIFSDGEWDLPDTAWKSEELLAWLFNDSPVKDEVVVNDRWGSNTRNKYNNVLYATSEYGAGMNPDIVWEESRGIGNSYGYNRMETASDYKSAFDLILILTDVVSRGGNLLLDVGPTADGRIPMIMQDRLLQMGKWLKKNGEAIYGTKPWTRPAQWSEGIMPGKSDKHYMADYDVAELAKPKKDTAFIEMFFTQKNDSIFCILPKYRNTVIIKDIEKNRKAIWLEGGLELPVKHSGGFMEIDLRGIADKLTDNYPLVIRLF